MLPAGVQQAPPTPPARVSPAPLGRWPVVATVLCLAAGILLHEILPPRVWLWLLTGLALAVGSLLAWRGWIGNLCIAIALVAVGLAAAQIAHYHFTPGHVGLYTGPNPRIAQLELRIVEPPRLLRTPDSAIPRPPKHTCLAEVTAVQTWTGWQTTTGRALLQFDTPCPQVRAGDILRVIGLLERPGEAMNPGQFDYAAYYRAQGVIASVSVDGPAMITRVGHAPPRPLVRLRERVRHWLVAGFDASEQEPAALLRALVLGERDPAMSDARDQFRKSGTSHHLAISGLHIAIVGGLAFALVRVLGGGPRTAIIVGGGIIALYGVVAAPSAPVIRATFLALAFGVGLLAGRRGPGVQLLAVAAVFVLLLNPLDLYRAGFQLSFGTVLGLLLFSSHLARWLSGAAHREFDVRRLQGDRLIFRITHWLDHRALSALAAAVVAWLVAMPLVAMHFEQFNPWAIPASLAAAPFVFLSLIAGVLKVVLTAALPHLAPLWADLAAWPVRAMQGIVAWFASRPAADIPLPAPSLTMIVLTYAALLLWLVRWPAPGLRWAARAPFPALCGAIFLLPYATSATTSLAAQPLRLTVLAVGAGQCAVVETPAGRVAMIDVGSTSLGDPVEKCVAPFLRHQGHAAVDLLVLSHANWDHYGGAADLTRRYGVGEVLVAEQFLSDARAFSSGRLMLDELVHLDRPPRRVRVGDSVPLGRQTTLAVLWPPAGEPDLSSNDASLVVKLTHAGRTVLFSGDIQEEAMRRLLRQHASDPTLLRADVLIAPHHGSSEESTARFVEAVNPSVIISSNGRTLAQKQRRFAELVGDRPLLRTHETGAVSVSIDDAGEMAVETHLGTRRKTLSYSE